MSARSAWFGSPGILGDVIEASPHSEVAVGADGTIAFVNERALRTFGYSATELVGAPVEVLLPDDLGDRHRHHRADFAARPTARPMGIGLEVMGRRRDGSLLPVEVSLTPIDTPSGSWVLCAIADVSARRRTEDTLKRVHRAYRTIAALNQAIVLAQGPDELFAEACRIAVDEGGYLGSWVVARGEGTTVRTLARAGAVTDRLDRIDFTLDPANPLSTGPTATAFLEDRPVFSADAAEEKDASWHRTAAAFGVRGTAALPLRREGRLVAVISLWSDRPRVFEGEHRELLEGLADNISFALDGFAASARLARLAQQRTDLLRRLVAAQEEERSRIAADVHDESVQALAAVDVRLGLLARRVQAVAPDLASSVAQLQDIVASVGTGLRDLLFDLETPDTEAGFDEALREAAGHVFEHSPVQWTLRVERPEPDDVTFRLSDGVHTQALRIAKEALINVRKHAHASTVEVVVRAVSGGVEVEVTDDGVGAGDGTGASDDVASAPGHRGVSTMRDRAELVGGWCRLERAEQGMRVRFWVPRVTPPVLSLTHQAHRG